MALFGIPQDVYETGAKALKEKHSKKEKTYKSAEDNFSGGSVREVLSDALRSRLGMTEEEFAEASDKLKGNSPAVINTSAAKSVISAAKSVLPDMNLTTSQSGNTAKPIVYSDWSPAAQQFGMDQQTAYAEHMANTAHQREVADLRAAGLNPVLGISGSGAGSVAGSAVHSGSSSAQKNLDLNGLFDFLGATAGLLATLKMKSPYKGMVVGQAVSKAGDKLGDFFK